MAGLTLSQAEAQLATWLAADTAVASGQSYSVAGRSLTRADAGIISDKIRYWDEKVQQLSRGGIGVRGVTPTG